MECCAKAITAWIVGKSEPILIFRRDLIDMDYSCYTIRQAIAQQMEFNDRR